MIRKALQDAVVRLKGTVCASCERDMGDLRDRLQGKPKLLQERGGITEKEAWQTVSDLLVTMGFDRLPKSARRIPKLYQVDHIVALEEGGPDEVSNCQILCTPCHRKKTAHHAGRRAKTARQQYKAKPKPAPVKLASKGGKKPNVQMPGVNSPVLNNLWR